MKLLVRKLTFLTPTPTDLYNLALMEYHCYNEKPVVMRIFEKGLELFGDEIEFVLRYLGFLISINDENSKWSVFAMFC